MSIKDAKTEAEYKNEILKPDMPPPASTMVPHARVMEMEEIEDECQPSTSAAAASASSGSSGGSALINMQSQQGQKWSNALDFDRILKQIRNAQRTIMKTRCDMIPKMAATSGQISKKQEMSVQCGHQMRQVNRLYGHDMRFYGISPKQKPREFVVCSECEGVYTLMGFQIHVTSSHPEMWEEIPDLVPLENIPKSRSDLAEQEAMGTSRGPPVRVEPLRNAGSTVATVNVPKATKTPAAPSTTSNNPRHKKKDKESLKTLAASSSGSSSKSSKNKRHKASSSTSASTAPAPEISLSHSIGNSKSSKKSKAEAKVIASAIDLEASSSNASLPLTSKVLGAASRGVSEHALEKEKKTSSKHQQISVSDAAAAAAAVATILPSSGSSSKRKAKGGHHYSKDNEASLAAVTASAASESSGGNTKGGRFHHGKNGSKSNTNNKKEREKEASSKALSKRELEREIENQLNELDQAVSSITEGGVVSGSKYRLKHKIKEETEEEADEFAYFYSSDDKTLKVPKGAATSALKAQTSENVAVEDMRFPARGRGGHGRARNNNAIAIGGKTQQLHHENESVALLDEDQFDTCEVSLDDVHMVDSVNNSNDDASMLMLEDMLDSKFLNEILNNTESDINFDEGELEEMAGGDQNYSPPEAKRMRYDIIGGHVLNTAMIDSDQKQQQILLMNPGSMDNVDYALYQPQQQHPQDLYSLQHHQYSQAAAAYATEDIKFFTAEQQQQQLLANMQNTQYIQQHQQYQHEGHPITTIDAAQLQQLLLQHQQQDHQQEPQPYELCVNNGAGNEVKMAGGYQHPMMAQEHFNVYNVPSLTDDDDRNEAGENVDAKSGQLVRIKVEQGNEVKSEDYREQQPNGLIAALHATTTTPTNGVQEPPIIYEINDNNQVMLMSQQRQQQVLAQLLHNNGCEDALRIKKDPEDNNHTKQCKSPPCPWDVDPHILCDFEFDKVDMAISLNSSEGESSTAPKSIKSEVRSESPITATSSTSNMYARLVDECCNNSNIYMYSGQPRPLAINSFGMVKVHKGMGVCMRKQLLSRKANNSPMSLNSGAGGGMVSLAQASSRFGVGSGSGARALGGYFPSSYPSPTSGGSSGEFNISNITVAQQQLSHTLEHSPSILTSRGGGRGGSKSKVQSSLTSPASSRGTGGAAANKTTKVSGTTVAMLGSSAKLTHRLLIPKATDQGMQRANSSSSSKTQLFTLKHITDIVNSSSGNSSKSPDSPIRSNGSDAKDSKMVESPAANALAPALRYDADDAAVKQMRHFYEHRKKLLQTLQSDERKPQHFHSNQQQQILLRQQRLQQQQQQPHHYKQQHQMPPLLHLQHHQQQQHVYKHCAGDYNITSNMTYCKPATNNSTATTTNGSDVFV